MASRVRELSLPDRKQLSYCNYLEIISSNNEGDLGRKYFPGQIPKKTSTPDNTCVVVWGDHGRVSLCRRILRLCACLRSLDEHCRNMWNSTFAFVILERSKLNLWNSLCFLPHGTLLCVASIDSFAL